MSLFFSYAVSMGKVRKDPLLAVNFKCHSCGATQHCEPDRVVDAPDHDYHPWLYYLDCDACGAEAEQVFWERNLLKANACATGPKTAEGLANTAKNLEGHPTPAETKLTRFNAMKHGLNARVASYFPAKPGKYPACSDCEHAENQDCVQYKACVKQTEIFLRYHAAVEQNDPELIKGYMADSQAGIMAMINQMLLSIVEDGGPRQLAPVWHGDKDGGINFVKYHNETTGEKEQIYDIKEHPLLKRFLEFVTKNSMSLEDMGLTAKSRDEAETLKGFLDHESDKQETESDFRIEQKKKTDELLSLLKPDKKPALDGEVERIG